MCELLFAGSEDRDVLPANKACGQPHPVHPEQGEAEGRSGHEELGAGAEGAQHGRHGVLPGEQR